VLAPQIFTRVINWPRHVSAPPGRPYVGLCPISLVYFNFLRRQWKKTPLACDTNIPPLFCYLLLVQGVRKYFMISHRDSVVVCFTQRFCCCLLPLQGVPKDFTSEGTLRACLGEIDRCYAENIMPFFVNMTRSLAHIGRIMRLAYPSLCLLGVPWLRPHRRQELATLPSVGANP